MRKVRVGWGHYCSGVWELDSDDALLAVARHALTGGIGGPPQLLIVAQPPTDTVFIAVRRADCPSDTAGT